MKIKDITPGKIYYLQRGRWNDGALLVTGFGELEAGRYSWERRKTAAVVGKSVWTKIDDNGELVAVLGHENTVRPARVGVLAADTVEDYIERKRREKAEADRQAAAKRAKLAETKAAVEVIASSTGAEPGSVPGGRIELSYDDAIAIAARLTELEERVAALEASR